MSDGVQHADRLGHLNKGIVIIFAEEGLAKGRGPEQLLLKVMAELVSGSLDASIDGEGKLSLDRADILVCLGALFLCSRVESKESDAAEYLKVVIGVKERRGRCR